MLIPARFLFMKKARRTTNSYIYIYTFGQTHRTLIKLDLENQIKLLLAPLTRLPRKMTNSYTPKISKLTKYTSTPKNQTNPLCLNELYTNIDRALQNAYIQKTLGACMLHAPKKEPTSSSRALSRLINMQNEAIKRARAHSHAGSDKFTRSQNRHACPARVYTRVHQMCALPREGKRRVYVYVQHMCVYIYT